MNIENATAFAQAQSGRNGQRDGSMTAERVALRLSGITKTFPGVIALNGVDFACRAGEVHALVGENGSGKSTLIKVAAGVVVPDSGTVQIGDMTLKEGDPRDSRRCGLMTAYQDTSLIGNLTVAQNIEVSFHILGEPTPEDLRHVLARYKLPFGPGDTVSSLGPGGRQMLEVVRAMLHSPKVLVLDEPTAALDMQTAGQLHDLIMVARDAGVAILFVSHRLEEVRRLADRLTVIRDGVIQGTHTEMNWQVEEIVELMVGAPVGPEFPPRCSNATVGTPLLNVRNIEGPGFGPVSITVHAREIVGVAGAEGNGQRHLLRGIIGIDCRAGSVHLDGKALAATPAASLQAGISFQSGDRAAESIFPAMSILDNSTLQLGRDAGPAGLALRRSLLPRYRQAVARLGIVTASPYQPIGALSGGNQQKVVLSRPILRAPKVLIVDEPCQGVDAKARLDIYGVLANAAEAGVGVLLNSSDSSELAGLCDRVYVMADGVVIDELQGHFGEADIVQRFVSASTSREASPNVPLTKLPSRRLAAALSSPQLPVLVLLLLLAVVSLYTTSQVPFFLTSSNVSNMMVLGLPLICAALGQQFNLITGGIDISIGASMTIAVCVASFVLSDYVAGSLIRGLLLVLTVGVAVGFMNACLTLFLKVNAIVATVATTGILTGIAVLLRPLPAGSIAPELATSTASGVGPVPFVVLGIVVVGLLLDLWLHLTRSGLSSRAVGLDAGSSQRIGIRTNRIKTMGYLAAALGAAVAGVFLSTQVGIGSNNVGLDLAIPTFTACFLGGATLNGGRGTFAGAMLGAIFLTVLRNATQFLGVPYAVSQLLYAAILLMAVAAYALASDGRKTARTRPRLPQNIR
ncbi:ATP-binding cassette domain-containing protein [Paraburkholderia sediminicola]|uniref:ATP-binding cassette domain-containing protein n=1 Tax=Paraburkholderia sediminicola TaxID=458836 RepID=UPI0038B960A3